MLVVASAEKRHSLSLIRRRVSKWRNVDVGHGHRRKCLLLRHLEWISHDNIYQEGEEQTKDSLNLEELYALVDGLDRKVLRHILSDEDCNV